MEVRRPAAMDQFEIGMAALMFRTVSPKRKYLEIGTKFGGSFRAFGSMMDEGASLASIDLGGLAAFGSVAEEMRQKGYEVRSFAGKSQSPAAVKFAKELGRIDVLLIDGSHNYSDVVLDIENYVPLVRAGGMVILHDCGILTDRWRSGPDGGDDPAAERNHINVRPAWESIAQRHPFVLAQSRCGLGFLFPQTDPELQRVFI